MALARCGAGHDRLLLPALLTLGVQRFLVATIGTPPIGVWRDPLFAALLALTLLYWGRLRDRAYSPALAEAQLQALQSRIRPHFLFNSLNAALGLIRSDPRRAETVLEDIADLFRVLMRDSRERVPLSNEIDLCKQYLAIEKLRLGDRLTTHWQVDDAALPALVPTLLLQPLIENAVHHGIEPSATPGSIDITIARVGRYVDITIANPWQGDESAAQTRGNRIGLDNVKQRLALVHDLEATLSSRRARRQLRGGDAAAGRTTQGATRREGEEDVNDDLDDDLNDGPDGPGGDGPAGVTRILIVDDEAPARARLVDLLSDIAADFPHRIVGEAPDGHSALDRLAETPADIALVDVQMPGMTGIELARHIGALPDPPAIVFVTAFDEYAVKAFEVHALDYLMKPVRAARLLEALSRVRSLAKRQTSAIAAAARDSAEAQGRRRDTIAVVERGRVLLVPVDDIVYLKAEFKYITIRTADREYLTEEPLVDLENEFVDRFVRVHRNALVARRAVAGFERVETVGSGDSVGEPHWVVTLRNVPERLPVSRRQWPIVKEAMRS